MSNTIDATRKRENDYASDLTALDDKRVNQLIAEKK